MNLVKDSKLQEENANIIIQQGKILDKSLNKDIEQRYENNVVTDNIDYVNTEGNIRNMKHDLKCRNDNIKNFNERYPSNADSSLSRTIKFHDNRPLDKILGTDIKFRGIFNFENVTKLGYLTLISGGINSFLEGIIIGIVFSTRNTEDIIPTVIAIVLGLIPKRVGDAGLLLHANFTIWGVIFWNTAINIFILPGTGTGLVVGGMEKPGHYYALSFVVGGFLYIALSEMVPIKVLATGFVNIILQTTFFLLGLGMMYIIVIVR